MSRLEIGIGSVVHELLERKHWYDPDKFTLRLSTAIGEQLAGGRSMEQSVTGAIEQTKTEFFVANRGAKSLLESMLPALLAETGIQEPGLLGVIERFKSYAERQLVSDLASARAEAPGRAHLQTYLESLGRTWREVVTGAGRSDIVLVLPDSQEVIETKVWNGKQYHEDGLLELAAFVRSEGLVRGFYVVFDFYTIEPLTPHGETWADNEVAVDIVYIHIPLTSPSRLGQARRRDARGDRDAQDDVSGCPTGSQESLTFGGWSRGLTA